MDNKGLHYTYNQYEIAPYSMGPIDVTIPYEDLKPILKPNNIIERFFPNKENKNPKEIPFKKTFRCRKKIKINYCIN